MRIISLFTALLCAFGAVAQGDEVSFFAEVPDTIPPGYVFEVRFSLKNAKGQDFQAPDFEGLTVVSGPNVSSSYQFINGSSSQEMAYTYSLKAEEAGSYAIGQASVMVEGESLRTEWEKIAVVEGYEMPVRKSRDPFDDFWDSRRMPDFPQAIPHGERPTEVPKRRKKRAYTRKKKTYRI
jgi:hypothetical protein